MTLSTFSQLVSLYQFGSVFIEEDSDDCHPECSVEVMLNLSLEVSVFHSCVNLADLSFDGIAEESHCISQLFMVKLAHGRVHDRGHSLDRINQIVVRDKKRVLALAGELYMDDVADALAVLLLEDPHYFQVSCMIHPRQKLKELVRRLSSVYRFIQPFC